MYHPRPRTHCQIKRSVLSATAALYFAGIAQAQALEEDGLYLAFRGYGAINDQNNLHFTASREFGGAAGYRFSDVWRVEAEYSRRWAKITGLNGALTTKGDFDSHTLDLHLFRDFRPEKNLRPFVGLGVGAEFWTSTSKAPQTSIQTASSSATTPTSARTAMFLSARLTTSIRNSESASDSNISRSPTRPSSPILGTSTA